MPSWCGISPAYVAGPLAAAAYGLGSIPAEWMGKIQATDEIERSLYDESE